MFIIQKRDSHWFVAPTLRNMMNILITPRILEAKLFETSELASEWLRDRLLVWKMQRQPQDDYALEDFEIVEVAGA